MKNNSTKHFVSVKVSPTESKHFEVPESVKNYIIQLEHALFNDRVKDTLCQMYSRLQKASLVAPSSSWISVNDQMPAKGVNVVVLFMNGDKPESKIARFDDWGYYWEHKDGKITDHIMGTDWVYKQSPLGFEVTHWMPIPESPWEE